MKIDAICIDKNGIRADVTVDLDYVADMDALRYWLDEELYSWSLKYEKSFDTRDFVVANWSDLVKELEDAYESCH